MYPFNIEFEFDPEKSRKNLEKHGVSFEEGLAFWTVPGVERVVPGYPELRWIRIGVWKEKYYTCIYTIREGRIRIISIRRSRENEVKFYQQRISDEKEET